MLGCFNFDEGNVDTTIILILNTVLLSEEKCFNQSFFVVACYDHCVLYNFVFPSLSDICRMHTMEVNFVFLFLTLLISGPLLGFV